MSESEFDGYSTINGTVKDSELVEHTIKLHQGNILLIIIVLSKLPFGFSSRGLNRILEMKEKGIVT